MHRCSSFSTLFFFFLLIATVAQGQIASSPFSEFGVGDLYTNGTAQNQGMGGIGISNGNPWYINSVNPALLTNNHVTAFQAGMQFEKKTLNNGSGTQSFQNGNLNYLMVAFPVMNNRWTTSMGLTPYSNVNYNLSYQIPAEGSYVPVSYQQTGKGGLNQFYWANGVKLNRYFSLGVKASYLFGSIITQNYSLNPIATANGGYYSRDAFHGLNFVGGLQVHFDSLFHKNYQLNIGGTITSGTNLNAQHIERIQSVSTRGVIIDSLTIKNEYGKLSIPYNFGLGISFGKVDHWTVGADFTSLDYQKFDYTTNDGVRQYIGNPTIGYRAALGGEIVPKPEDFTNYLNRITYRIGASYEKSPMLVNGREVKDIGGTLGFSLPVSSISTIDVGIKIGKRGTLSQNSLEENYFRVYFGITFNDRFWFIKRKFD